MEGKKQKQEKSSGQGILVNWGKKAHKHTPTHTKSFVVPVYGLQY